MWIPTPRHQQQWIPAPRSPVLQPEPPTPRPPVHLGFSLWRRGQLVLLGMVEDLWAILQCLQLLVQALLFALRLLVGAYCLVLLTLVALIGMVDLSIMILRYMICLLEAYHDHH